LLQKVPAVYRTEINDVLLTALVQTFTQWTKGHSLLVDLEGTDEKHRKRYRFIADNRLVYNYLPSAANFGGFFQPGEALKAIKNSSECPESGHWLWSAALSERGHFSDRATANSQAEVRFNYLGQLDQVLSESALFEVDRTPGTSRTTRQSAIC